MTTGSNLLNVVGLGFKKVFLRGQSGFAKCFFKNFLIEISGKNYCYLPTESVESFCPFFLGKYKCAV